MLQATAKTTIRSFTITAISLLAIITSAAWTGTVISTEQIEVDCFANTSREPRDMAPLVSDKAIAMLRKPSKITPGPQGSWPLRFDKLGGPVLQKSRISCHNPKSKEKDASPLDLTPTKAYNSFISFAKKYIEKLAFEKEKQ